MANLMKRRGGFLAAAGMLLCMCAAPSMGWAGDTTPPAAKDAKADATDSGKGAGKSESVIPDPTDPKGAPKHKPKSYAEDIMYFGSPFVIGGDYDDTTNPYGLWSQAKDHLLRMRDVTRPLEDRVKWSTDQWTVEQRDEFARHLAAALEDLNIPINYLWNLGVAGSKPVADLKDGVQKVDDRVDVLENLIDEALTLARSNEYRVEQGYYSLYTGPLKVMLVFPMGSTDVPRLAYQVPGEKKGEYVWEELYVRALYEPEAPHIYLLTAGGRVGTDQGKQGFHTLWHLYLGDAERERCPTGEVFKGAANCLPIDNNRNQGRYDDDGVAKYVFATTSTDTSTKAGRADLKRRLAALLRWQASKK